MAICVGLACEEMGQAWRQMVLMGTTREHAEFPLPGICVHLDTCGEMSALLKVVVVRKEPFPKEIYSYLFLGANILPVPHAPWQP